MHRAVWCLALGACWVTGDELSAKVERAAFLIRTCRERIQQTELKVQRVLEDLEEA